MFFVPNTVLQCESGQHYLPRPDYEFLKSLSSQGYRIKIVGFVSDKSDPFLDSRLDDIEDLSILNIGGHLQYSGKLRKMKFYLNAVYRCSRYLAGDDEFVYIYFPSHLAKIIGLYYSLFGKRYGLYVRGVWGTNGPAGWIAERIFRHAMFIFTTGPAFAKTISPINPHTEPVYPMTTFTPEAVEMVNRTGRPIKNVLFVGHVRKRKGVLDSIKAIQFAGSRGLDLTLHIIGGGDDIDIEMMNSVAEEFGIEDHVVYHGHVSDSEDLKRHFSQADVFVYPSYYPEGFPRVIYEAMIFGLPIISTILPGMKGFAEDGVNCLKVDPESPEQIADALLRLDAEPELRDRLERSSRQGVIEYYGSFAVKGHADQFCHKARELGIHGD